jgi:hypothetical protein
MITSSLSRLYRARDRMIKDREAAVEVKTGRSNRITRKPAPVPLCPQQNPHDLTWHRISYFRRYGKPIINSLTCGISPSWECDITRHEDVWGSGYIDPRILDLGTSPIWVVTSPPCRFTPGKIAPDTHWIGGWMGCRAGLDDVKSRKILPCRDSNPDPSAVQPIGSCYTDQAIRAVTIAMKFLLIQILCSP